VGIWLMTNSTAQSNAAPAEPKFNIGQNVHLKTGGAEMIVNQCVRGVDGKFVVHTIWFDATIDNRRAEARGSYPEALLDAEIRPLSKKARMAL
jgi:uncharacterized protein YodC (DUF2158 family)